MTLLIGALTLGLILSLLALGVLVSFRIFSMADITTDGSITLGASITAVLLVKGVNPVAATLCGAAGGAVAGAVTGQAIEERATREEAWQFTVELDGGRTITIVQARDQTFVVGERVRVYMRRDGAARVAKA
jgi:outer membrane lipoprotein SlyB